jgi:hypothetical protein
MADIFDELSGSDTGDIFDQVSTSKGRMGMISSHTPGAKVMPEKSYLQRVADPENMKAYAKKVLAPMARPALEGGGAVLGGLAGMASPVPGGAIIGAGLGYAGGARGADLIEGKQRTLSDASLQSVKDVGTGAMFEMGGQAAVPVLSGLAAATGKVVKPVLGKLSGTGPGAVEEALKSGKETGMSLNPFKSKTQYDKALRGKINGEEIVDNARSALTSLKNQRATAYQDKLAIVDSNTQPIDLVPIKQDLMNLLDRYKVKIQPVMVKGHHGQMIQKDIDTSRVPMGAKGRADIEEIIEKIRGWGSQPGDNTASGLDTLKRQLDDFYSDSSQARQFVTEIRGKVRDAIVKHVPEYDDMTKGYADATKLIKDVEADLSLRKQGMSGRVTADKTLRRLMSSMRDNFELRKDLVEILGNKGNQDLAGEIAGYSQNTFIPRGLAGTGPALIGSASIARFIDPSFASVLVASSPRVQGEFLRLFGKAIGEVKALGPTGQKALMMQTGISAKEAAQ